MGYRTTAHDELLEAEDDDMDEPYEPRARIRSERCGDCLCCTEEQCRSLSDNDCPRNSLGDSTCPCTCD